MKDDLDLGTTAWEGNHRESPSSGSLVSDSHSGISAVLAKEKTMREIVELRDGLRALVGRVDEVTGECERLQSKNETLIAVVENMSRGRAVTGNSR